MDSVQQYSPSTQEGWRAVPIRDHLAEIRDVDGAMIAVIVDNLGPPGRALAWAQVMAAASDLLYACDLIVTHLWDENAESGVTDACTKAVLLAAAAVARARGQQPAHGGTP